MVLYVCTNQNGCTSVHVVFLILTAVTTSAWKNSQSQRLCLTKAGLEKLIFISSRGDYSDGPQKEPQEASAYSKSSCYSSYWILKSLHSLPLSNTTKYKTACLQINTQSEIHYRHV